MARRTKEDALATRAALLDAAECAFQQKGVARTSLADIAQQAGMTRGAIYWHFKDKTDLFTAMMERVTLPLHARLEAVAQAGDGAGDAVALLCESIGTALRQIRRNAQTRRVLEIACLMVEHVDELGALRSRHAREIEANVSRIANVLTRAARQRQRPLPAPADTLARGLDALIYGLVHHWLLNPVFALENTARHTVAAYLSGIGLPLPRPPKPGAPGNQG
ncbi:TetR family transcriptional regulator [Comamonadaceae bacterium OH2545_COT-014]|nr:TetR family transcriptional regulator [Comamonadaceae bacterium OH2545_COT-014]